MSKQLTALSRQTPRKHAPSRSRRSPWAWFGGVWLATRPTSQAAPGQWFPIQGQQHITPGQTHPAYNSDPPTSGWHSDTPLASGFHE